MNELTSFAIGVGITLVMSAGVVIYLRAPLRSILIDLCEKEDRADFWVAFSMVTLVITPLICALFYRPQAASGAVTLLHISDQLKWALLGLIGSVMLLGLVIARFIPPPSRS